jgi:putative transposase
MSFSICYNQLQIVLLSSGRGVTINCHIIIASFILMCALASCWLSYSWLWNLMDSTTRFWICSKIFQKHDIHAGVELLQDMKQRAPLPKAFVHDGLRTYDEAYQRELFTLKNPRIKNVRSLGSSDEGLNPKVERLNGTMRDRETVMRSLDNAEAAQELVDAMRIHYNFIRPNQAIGGQTPAEAAGIDLNLGENKIERLGTKSQYTF